MPCWPDRTVRSRGDRPSSSNSSPRVVDRCSTTIGSGASARQLGVDAPHHVEIPVDPGDLVAERVVEPLAERLQPLRHGEPGAVVEHERVEPVGVHLPVDELDAERRQHRRDGPAGPAVADVVQAHVELVAVVGEDGAVAAGHRVAVDDDDPPTGDGQIGRGAQAPQAGPDHDHVGVLERSRHRAAPVTELPPLGDPCGLPGATRPIIGAGGPHRPAHVSRLGTAGTERRRRPGKGLGPSGIRSIPSGHGHDTAAHRRRTSALCGELALSSEGISMQEAARRAVRAYARTLTAPDPVSGASQRVRDAHADALRRLGE